MNRKEGSRTENPEGECQLKLNAHLPDEGKNKRLIYFRVGCKLLSYCVPVKCLAEARTVRFQVYGGTSNKTTSVAVVFIDGGINGF